MLASPSVPPSSSSSTRRVSPASGSSRGSADGSPISTSASIADATASGSLWARKRARSFVTPGSGISARRYGSSARAGLPPARRSSARSTPSATSLNRSNARPGERLARGRRASASSAPEDVDEQIDHARAFELAEELREAREAQRRFVLVLEGQRLAASLLEGRDHPCRVLLRPARRARRAPRAPRRREPRERQPDRVVALKDGYPPARTPATRIE